MTNYFSWTCCVYEPLTWKLILMQDNGNISEPLETHAFLFNHSFKSDSCFLLCLSACAFVWCSRRGTWARSVTCRPSWKKPQRRSRKSKKRYSKKKHSYASALQSLGNLLTALALLSDYASAFLRVPLIIMTTNAWFLCHFFSLWKLQMQSTCK